MFMEFGHRLVPEHEKSFGQNFHFYSKQFNFQKSASKIFVHKPMVRIGKINNQYLNLKGLSSKELTLSLKKPLIDRN